MFYKDWQSCNWYINVPGYGLRGAGFGLKVWMTRSVLLRAIKYLVYAHASCDETILHLNFLNNINGFENGDLKYFSDGYYKLGRKTNQFIKYVESNWE